ncbi:MAG: restriction endonuclease [Verrucomicrobia bacterium]|nr:restriction endonuclease [Verrucomicrobiota bacterium]
MPAGLAQAYKSPVQKARVVSEGWGHDNLYCPHCPAPVLISSPPNTQAVDYVCPRCGLPFQLKSQSSPLGNRIVDAGYEAMMRAIREDRTPNLFVLHYARDYWEVRNVILVPHFIFSASAVEKRKPLAATARRAGWVGCNIVLRNIPLEARINLVRDGNVESPARVRDQYRRLEPLKEIGVQQRGWTLDVLHLVQSLGKREFTNAEVYAFERRLEELHPDNRHIRDKIRQQLQVLRDRGFLVQVERGVWAMK